MCLVRLAVAGHKPTAWLQISCGAACSSSGSRCRRTDNHTRGGRLVARAGRAEHEYRILSEFSAVEATSPPAQVHGRDEEHSKPRANGGTYSKLYTNSSGE